MLELAAKAAGWSHWDWLAAPGINVYDADGRHSHWNPLTDDGDALRLAVKLGFFLELYTDDDCLKDRMGSVTVRGFININEEGANVDEAFNVGDPYAATRRAIVRAAAEIGAHPKQHNDGGAVYG
ncbi:hypothetical protein [Achromobacter insolitus]|uniref:hypothetical protein n=1 Tax=Achromobacter insolitus TaxID=217204 RepID=UPI002FDFE2DA